MKRFPLFIPFHLSDMAGIAFFGHIITLCHQSVEQFIVACGIPWDEWYNSKEQAAPIKGVNTNFLKPVLPGREYFFDVSIAKTGTSSLSFNINVLDKNEILHAEVQITLVYLSLPEVKPTPLPERYKKLLETI